LYPALDAMALFAVRSGRPELAVRITACAQAAHESHGKPGRSPAAERVRSAVQEWLDSALGPGWNAGAGPGPESISEEEACLLALGLKA
jgi:hypothetical protein